MAQALFSAQEPDTFVLGLLDENGAPRIQLFTIPFAPGLPNTLHPAAARSLKVTDLLRLAKLFLGLFSFDSSRCVGPSIPQITVHKELDGGVIEPECCLSAIGDKPVGDFRDTTLWLSINVQGEKHVVFADISDDIIREATALPFDKKCSTEDLGERFRKAYTRNPDLCEFSGDKMAVVPIHLVPFELGSAPLFCAASSLQTAAIKAIDKLDIPGRNMRHDAQNPIIGNAELLHGGYMFFSEAKDCINLAENLFVASCTLNAIDDKFSGILKSTRPFTWLAAEETVFTTPYFTDEATIPGLPPPPAPSLQSTTEHKRYALLWLTDIRALFERFASPSLRDKITALRTKLLCRLRALQAERVAGQATNALFAQPGIDYLACLLTDPDTLDRVVFIPDPDSSFTWGMIPAPEDPEDDHLTYASKRLLADVFGMCESEVTSDQLEPLRRLNTWTIHSPLLTQHIFPDTR